MTLRIFDFTDGFTSSVNPSSEAIKTRGFEPYVSDAAFVADNGTAENGDAYYNTTINKVKVYANGNWVEVASFEP